jgi:catechol 2,3-dioxygenase-like lactoylglutathione lyase family enzyme
MKIKVTSVYVNDQDKALRYYTEVLGFVKKADFTQGPFRWLTVASPEEPGGTELQLAPNGNPAALAYQQAMLKQGQPAAMFYVDDVQREHDRMKPLGGGVHHAAHQGDRLDHRHAERHVRQPDPDRRPRPLPELIAWCASDRTLTGKSLDEARRAAAAWGVRKP